MAIVLIYGSNLDISSRKDSNIVGMAYYFASKRQLVFSLDYLKKSDSETLPLDWKQKTANEDVLKIDPANRDVKAAIR
jgi:para-nitrobenzyl esterase